MENNKLEKLKKVLELLSETTISPEQLAQFLKAVTESIQKTKASLSEENTQTSKELRSRLEQSLTELEEGQISLKTALQGIVDGRIGILTKNTENTLGKAQQALSEIKKIEINKPLDGIDGVDGSPDTRKEIVEKINKGKKSDLKIEAKQIEGIDKFTTQESLDRAIAILDTRSQYLINKTVKVDGTTITGNGTDSSPLVAVSTGSALTVQDIDGTPTATNVNTIKFTNGAVTNDGAGVVTVTTGAGGGGDMVLATAQTNIGAKTFNDATLLMRNVAGTFNGSFTNTNTADRIYTLQNRAGTLADDTDLALKANLASPTFTGTVTIPTGASITTPVLTGLPTGSGVASAATASTLASRDANANLAADNLLQGYTTTVTAAGTTTLTVDSTYLQFFTGSSTQTLTLPVASTLVLGQQFYIRNNSTGAVTINSSGANLVRVLAGNTRAFVTCILASGTTAASWSVSYIGANITDGKILNVSNTLTLAGTDATTMTFPTTSATIARTDAAQSFTGVQTMTSPSITTSLVTASASFDLVNTTATTLNLGGAATTLTIGATTGTMNLRNVTLTCANATSFALNGVSPAITSTSTGTGALFNTNILTGTAYGAATTLTIGGTPTTAITHNYSTNATAAATTKTVNVATGGAASSTTNVNIGSANGGTTTVNSLLITLGGTTGATATGTIELGHATDTTLSRSAAGVGAIEGVVITTEGTTTEASSATTTIAIAGTRHTHTITALAAADAFAAPTSVITLSDRNTLVIRIKDNATARALTWNAVFRAIGVTLPTTTVISKTLYVGFKYNVADTKWDCIASALEA